MPDPDDRQRLRDLDARLAAARKGQAPGPRGDEHYSGAQLAWRMVIELVAGLMIGFGIGYGLDALFGTTPWLMVLFILLGLAAGVQTMLRTAKAAQEEAARTAARDGEG